MSFWNQTAWNAIRIWASQRTFDAVFEPKLRPPCGCEMDSWYSGTKLHETQFGLRRVKGLLTPFLNQTWDLLAAVKWTLDIPEPNCMKRIELTDFRRRSCKSPCGTWLRRINRLLISLLQPKWETPPVGLGRVNAPLTPFWILEDPRIPHDLNFRYEYTRGENFWYVHARARVAQIVL